MIRRWLTEAFSARGLLLRAALIALAYGVCHLLGWRDYTSILSGTVPASDGVALRNLHSLLGLLYVFAYFAFVLIAPILAIAGMLMALAERLWQRRVRAPTEP